MELRTLRYFAAIAAAGSVNAAAGVVHVTQPALSRQLRQLEQELGVQLFTRQPGRLTLSAAGRQLLPLAEDLLARAEAVRRTASALAAGRLESVRLAAPATTLTDVVAPFLATWGPDDPVPAVQEASPADADRLLRQDTDLAVVTQRPDPEWACRPIAVLPIWAYVPADHAWASRSEVGLPELGQERLLVMTSGYQPRLLLDAAMHRARLTYTPAVENDNAQVAQALAAAGRGVAVVSDDPRFDLAGVPIVGVDGPLRIELWAAWDESHHAAAALGEIADRLSTFTARRYGAAVS